MKTKKILALALAAVLLVAVGVGGTLAWLLDVTAPVTNTFTTSNVDITLTETTTNYQMVPGNAINKNPLVTVHGASEESYVFVKVTKSDNYSTYLQDYQMAEGWTLLADDKIDDANVAVYWKTVAAVAENTTTPLQVLAGGTDKNTDGQVFVKDSVTNQQMDQAKTNAPTLTFVAYAVQKANVADENAAWALAMNLGTADIYGKTALN